MAADADSDPIKDFQSSLNDLSFNSKPLINMLTMLSEDYKDSKAPQIVRCIEHRLHSVSAEKKLPVLYLMDSICKNVGKPYVDLFTQNIVSNFCEVFEKSDEKTRLSLYKLRQTWSSIFPQRKLFGLDSRIKDRHDPAWPITAKVKPETNNADRNSKPELKSVIKPANSGQKVAPKVGPNPTGRPKPEVHINPKFLNEKKIPPIAGADPQSAELAKQLIQKQNELLQIQKQKLEYDMMIEKKKLEEQARALQEKEMKLKQKEQAMNRGNSPNGRKIKKRKRSRSQRSRTPSPSPPQKSKSPTHRWNQSPNKRDPHRSRSPQVVKPFIPSQSGNQLSVNSSIPSKILSSSGMTGSSGQPPVPTTIPAPTILAQPEMLNMSRIDSSVVTTMSSRGPMTSSLSSHNVIPSHLNNNIETDFPSFGQDRDYRKDFDYMMKQANEKLRLGDITPAAHQSLVREIGVLRDAENNNLNNSAMNVSVKEPPDTFTMPVDGKFRKLYYLDDTTAVVLLTAPPNMSFEDLVRRDQRSLDPRQISFEGNPTYIHIDNDRHTGETILLDFNGQEYVHIPRSKDPAVTPIPQRIKFGGPGKEIILNGQPYAAKFGGPAIQVWFEGDRTGPHTLQLDGPTPRVKLSEQRRYDLWNQVMNRAAKEAKGIAPNSTVQPTSDINNLLSKLIAAGMLDKKTQNNSPKPNISSPKEEFFEPEVRERIISNDPPIKLTSESLKIPRPSVVAALYRGIQCTNCSLRFDDKTSANKTRYSQHLDWHFRQNRRDKAKPNSSAASMRRNWYYPLNLWVQFKEVTDEEDTTGLFQTEENESEEQEPQSISTVIAEKDESLNFCAVCGEKFDQQWNEEEEEWRLQNALKHTDNRIYHPFCLNDFIAQTQRLEEQTNECASDQEIPAIANEESLKPDPKEETNETDIKPMDTEEQSETISEVKNELNVEAMDTNEVKERTDEDMPKVSDSSDTPEVEPEAKAEAEEEENIKVFELEIPIHNDSEVKHDLSDILESKELTEKVDQQLNETKELSDETKSEEKVVLQKGGIVIKMKSSNPKTQTIAPPVEPQETEEKSAPEVIVRGQELSSLCTIL